MKTLMRPDPIGLPRNPFQVWALCICIISGIPLLFGIVTAQSVEASLPRVYVFTWGLMLVLGAGAALAGMFWPGDPGVGVLIKRTGLMSVGFAAVVYASVLALFFGVGAGLVILFAVSFAVACFVQVHQINKHIKRVLARRDRDL